MPALRDDFGFLTGLVDRLARHRDARGRFERNARNEILSRGYAAERAACIVLVETVRPDLVAMLTAALGNGAKSGAELDTLDGVDAHQRVSDRRLELVEHRFTESRGNIAREHADLRTDRITELAQFVHERFEFGDALRVRAEKRVRVDI